MNTLENFTLFIEDYSSIWFLHRFLISHIGKYVLLQSCCVNSRTFLDDWKNIRDIFFSLVQLRIEQLVPQVPRFPRHSPKYLLFLGVDKSIYISHPTLGHRETAWVGRELAPSGGSELNYDGIWSSPTKDADPRQHSNLQPPWNNHLTWTFVPNFNYPRQG